MTNYPEITEQQIAMDFFKSPTGTVLCERGSYYQSAIYAVKLPLGSETRFSVVMAERLPKNYFNETGAYLPRDWKLSLDSYVDNETGNRVVCDPYSEFGQILDYKNGILLTRAYAEVEASVRKKLLTTPEDALFQAALAAGKNPTTAQNIKDEEAKRIRTDCQRAFAFDMDPDPYAKFLNDLEIERLVPIHAQFAVSYLKDKNQLIQSLADQLIPKYAVDIIHQRMIKQETKRYMEELSSAPSPALLKERDIRKTIVGKSTVWATFGKGDQTMRMCIPTSMFHSTSELLKWVLPDKDIHRLQAFLEDPDSKNVWSPHIDDIVALDYKGKTLYQDGVFFERHHNTGETPSFDSILQAAQTRAETQLQSPDIGEDFVR